MNAVLVVGPSDALRCSIVAALRQEGHTATAIADDDELASSVAAFSPDLLIFVSDDGLCAERLRAVRALTRAGIIVTCRPPIGGADDRVVACLRSGADDCVPQPFRTAELIARADAVLRRTSSHGRSIEVGELVVADDAAVATRAGQEVELTATERRVLAELAQTPNRVVPKTQLVAAIWGADTASDNTLEVHVSSLRRRLGPDGRRHIKTVRGQGYRLVVNDGHARR